MIKPISIVIPYQIQNDEVFLWVQKRDSQDELRGLWEFPGGKIEIGESPEETALREVQEETQVQINREELIKFKNYTDPSGILLMVFLYPDQSSNFSTQGMFSLEALLKLNNEIPPKNKEILLDLQTFFS